MSHVQMTGPALTLVHHTLGHPSCPHAHISPPSTSLSTRPQCPPRRDRTPIDWTRAEPQRIVEKSTLPLTAPRPHSRRLRAIVHRHPIVSIPAAAHLSGIQRHQYILCVSVTADTGTNIIPPSMDSDLEAFSRNPTSVAEPP